jgi:hypothetical protein
VTVRKQCPLQRFNRPKQTVSFLPTQVTAAWRPLQPFPANAAVL